MATTAPHRILSFPSPQRTARQEHTFQFHGALLGPSTAVSRLRDQIARVGPHFRAALDAVARTLHALSPLSAVPLQVLAAEEAESLLRQPAPTAATAATAATAGETLRGVLYLPHFTRLTLSSQRALLRILRLRGPQAVRLIAFAEEDLRGLVAAGSMLAELVDILQSVRICVPALSQRAEDLPLLANHLLERLARHKGDPLPPPDASFASALQAAEWPGNFRDLHRALRHALQQAAGRPLTGEHLSAALEAIHASRPATPAPAREKLLRLDHVVQRHVRDVLVSCGGNKLRAAQALGISRSTLYRMLEQPHNALSFSMAS
jgi:DNA-binding NtrC family response regulator